MVDISEVDKLEYQEAMNIRALDSGFRRKGLTFIATLQAVFIAVMSNFSVENPILTIPIAVFAIAIALLGLNNDFRLSRYMEAYEVRLIEIENKYNMRLAKLAKDVQHTRSPLLSNEAVFRYFFLLLAIGWTCFLVWAVLVQL